MGICVSCHTTSPGGSFLNLPSAAQVIHWNGRLQELWQPTKAEEILTQNPDFFLCCSEAMNVDSVPGEMAKDEVLQLGQLYFLIPVPKINQPFSLQDLCTLAVKGSKALNCNPGTGRSAAFQMSAILPDQSSPLARFCAGTLAEFPKKAINL
ncbi:OLC1v1003110C1 [Oldenlandia corymbosa var. corymbosa]|uniref:OLC1v1003110C1 n=1 Tax=Oldenlandia corymbosa var. corymbosa TaxID=529605 RepID=A0AAV1DCP2_OLDCO|nr:OLC1v1003110C1 [Oldenlandia corymbosa var. corymbosa]